MLTRRLLSVLVLGCLGMAPAASLAQSAADSFAQGKTLLAEGQLQQALGAFAAAARADRNNTEYLQQYTMLRQIIELRTRLESERDPQRWEYVARALHSYYFSQAMYPMALELSQRMLERLKDATSAVLVAETALAMDKSDVAVQALSGVEASQLDSAGQALLGVALARQGKQDQAKKILKSIQLTDEERPGTLYTVARLQAATGDAQAAAAMLVKCFESTPPSRLDGFKQYARQCQDFAGMASTPEFQKALETASKVAESKCSGGAGCANCPMRGKCQGQGQK